ncbi:MAG: energy transducer TonB [Pseudomonadota bacterium]
MNNLTIGKTRLLVAFILAVSLHLIIAAWIFTVPTVQEGPAKALGYQGIEIALGPAGRSQGGPEKPIAQEDSQQEPQKTPDVKPAEPLKPTIKELPKATTEPVLEPVQAKQPVQEKTPPPKPVQPEPVKLEPLQAEPTPQKKPPVEIAQPTTAPGNAGQSGTTEHDDVGSGDNSQGGGLTGEMESYTANLLAWLERHKKYPKRAKARRQQGTVMLSFVIDRQGVVLSQSIQKSSGYTHLDKEALKMLKRASPLPAIPESMQKETLPLVVPVEFFLR